MIETKKKEKSVKHKKSKSEIFKSLFGKSLYDLDTKHKILLLDEDSTMKISKALKGKIKLSKEYIPNLLNIDWLIKIKVLYFR